MCVNCEQHHYWRRVCSSDPMGSGPTCFFCLCEWCGDGERKKLSPQGSESRRFPLVLLLQIEEPTSSSEVRRDHAIVFSSVHNRVTLYFGRMYCCHGLFTSKREKKKGTGRSQTTRGFSVGVLVKLKVLLFNNGSGTGRSPPQKKPHDDDSSKHGNNPDGGTTTVRIGTCTI